ncbi:PadR family transcriptional regulator [Phaeacidiphilus oryzae]|jgi:DNA-binding PadR family transcriptional regulator|uniref:PadR family transcriptional regulator n=1 Tax=Phaeacidiphilus oryzae TaxID=348818 RepID=UPI000563B008|nr:PadR family transcriptional regulator [Phaeacidiphilus oryzae]
MARRRRPGNPLALAVLTTVAEQPRHPYEIAQVLRERGKEYSIKINYGSLYTVVQTLERNGLIEAVGTERDGRRPERTVYGATDEGREELRDWLADWLSVHQKEYPRFESALSLMGALPPDEVRDLLEIRLRRMDAENAGIRGTITQLRGTLPRIFLLETEYALAMAEAEADWVRGLLGDFDDESLDGLAGWREYHRTGAAPKEWTELPTVKEGRRPTS